MSLRDFFRRKARIFAATTPNSADIPENERYWRQMGGTSRNLPSYDQQRMCADSVRAYQRDGMARSAVRIKTGFVVGAVATVPQVVAEDSELRERIEEHVLAFWTDSRNNMERRTRNWSDSLTTAGELFTPAHTDMGGSGHVLMGFIDPLTVTDAISDPLDAQTPIAALRRIGTGASFAHPIIGADGALHAWFIGKETGDTVTIPGHGLSGGDLKVIVQPPTFYLPINDLSGQTRGISDLYPVLDLLDLLDRMGFSSAARNENMAAFSWVFEASESTADKDIESLAKKFRKSIEDGSGNFLAYKGGSLKAVAPQIQAADWESATKTIRRAILAGLVYPESWFDSSATTFAAAGDGASPALTALQERQSLYRSHLEDILTYVARQLPEARQALEADRKAWRIELPLPVIVGKDTMRESAVLVSDLNAIGTGVAEGWLTEEAAKRLAADAYTSYGMTIRPDDQPDAATGREDRLKGMPFPTIAAPSNQTQPNAPGKEGGRGEDAAHTEAA